jgi:hypothetical protein
VDYELIFETRIIDDATGWLVRASSLNDYALLQINNTSINYRIRAGGIWTDSHTKDHEMNIRPQKWFTVRTRVYGSSIIVYIKVNGHETTILDEELFKPAPPIMLSVEVGSNAPKKNIDQFIIQSVQTGSFGFRLWGKEKAQFRNIYAHKIK